MGGGQSINQYVENNTTNEQTTNFLNSMKTDSNVNVVVVQNALIKFKCEKMTVRNGDFKVGQNSRVTVTVIQLTSAGISSKQLADLKTAIANDAQALQSKANEDFGAVLGAAQEGQNANTTIVNTIRNVVTSNITNESVSSLFAKAQADQNGEIVFNIDGECDIEGSFEIDQNIQLDMIAHQMVNSAIDQVMQTAAVAEIVNKVVSENDASNTGLATVVEKVGGAIGNILQSGQFLFVVMGIVAVAGIFIYVTKGKRMGGARRPPAPGPARGFPPPARGYSMPPPYFAPSENPNLMFARPPYQAPPPMPQYQMPQYQAPQMPQYQAPPPMPQYQAPPQMPQYQAPPQAPQMPAAPQMPQAPQLQMPQAPQLQMPQAPQLQMPQGPR